MTLSTVVPVPVLQLEVTGLMQALTVER